MTDEGLTPLLTASIAFAYVGGIGLVVAGVVPGVALSRRRGHLHPLLLVCLSARSISWTGYRPVRPQEGSNHG